MFWVIAAMILTGEIWRVATPGQSGSDSPGGLAHDHRGRAALLGLPDRRAAQGGVDPGRRPGAQLAAPGGLQRRSAQPQPGRGRTGAPAARGQPVAAAPAGSRTNQATTNPILLDLLLAGLAYFVVNFLLVTCAISLSTRTPLRSVIRAKLPYQAGGARCPVRDGPARRAGDGDPSRRSSSRSSPSRSRPSTSTPRSPRSANTRRTTTS